MENNIFLSVYMDDNNIQQYSNAHHPEFGCDLENNKIHEYAQKGLYYYSVANTYTEANRISVSETMQKYELSKDVLFCKNSCLQMGYFCSNPVIDLIVGKTKRGKISRRKFFSGLTHTYYFINNRLVLSKCNNNENTLLFYAEEENKVYEFCYIGNKLYDITECCYDEKGRIIKRTNFSYQRISDADFLKPWKIKNDCQTVVISDMQNNTNNTFKISEDKIFYTENRISALESTEYISSLSSLFLHKYLFNYKDEFYSDYDFYNCLTGYKSNYKVYKKRKFDEFIYQPQFYNFTN